MKMRLVAIVLLLLALAGCGGGTSGTGVTSIQGTAKIASGAALQGADVVVSVDGEDKQVTTTNSAGAFSLDIESDESSLIVLTFSSDSRSASVELRERRDGTERIDLIVEVDLDRNTAVVRSQSDRRVNSSSNDPVNGGNESSGNDRGSGNASGSGNSSTGGNDRENSHGSGSGGNRGNGSAGGSSSSGHNGGSQPERGRILQLSK